MSKILNQIFNIPSNFFTMDNKFFIIASLGGLGYAKKAPGTVASAVVAVVAYWISLISPSLLIILAILSTVVGLYVSDRVYAESGLKDPSYVVIDEMAGMLISLLLAGSNIFLFIIAFISFRILDIRKPWLIGMAETRFHAGTAIMMDDVIAGLFTMIIVIIASMFM